MLSVYHQNDQKIYKIQSIYKDLHNGRSTSVCSPVRSPVKTRSKKNKELPVVDESPCVLVAPGMNDTATCPCGSKVTVLGGHCTDEEILGGEER